MPTKRPTVKQQQTLDFIKLHLKSHGFSPSFREIGRHLNVSVGGVHSFLAALEARGIITRNANEARSIQLVESK